MASSPSDLPVPYFQAVYPVAGSPSDLQLVVPGSSFVQPGFAGSLIVIGSVLLVSGLRQVVEPESAGGCIEPAGETQPYYYIVGQRHNCIVAGQV